LPVDRHDAGADGLPARPFGGADPRADRAARPRSPRVRAGGTGRRARRMSRANAARLSDRVSLEIQRQLANTPRYNRWLADLVRPAVGRRVLDLGAGLGNVTAHLLDRDLIVALEPDPVFCAELHARFDAHPQARVLAGALPDAALTAELRALSLDTVV